MTHNTAGNAGDTAPVEVNGSGNSPEQAAKIAELEARLAKETKDKEIYRAGLLAAKDLGKSKRKLTPEDLADPDKLDSAIEAKIQDKEAEAKLMAEAESKAAQDEALRKENEELRRALEATTGASYASVGSGVNERSESKPQGYWSEAQKNELRSIYQGRGLYTPEQIDKMVAKAEEIARNKTAQSARPNDLTKTRSY